ncbi:uncharacterized protein LOC144101654 [Amblyomma americanum]
MRSSATLAILVLLGFLSSGCYASTCANFSLPNFLDIGKCLKKSGDLCSANTQGVVEFLEDLTRCLFEGIATLDLGNQFYLLYNYLLYLLDRNDFDIVLPAIKDLCKSFNTATGGLITLSCDALKFKKNAVCGKPIFISFVTSTPFAKCLDVTGLTCDENKPVDEPAVIGFLRVLACLTGYILNTSPSDTYKVLVCFIVTFFLRIFGPLGFIVFRTPLCAFLKAVRVTCSSIRC